MGIKMGRKNTKLWSKWQWWSTKQSRNWGATDRRKRPMPGLPRRPERFRMFEGNGSLRTRLPLPVPQRMPREERKVPGMSRPGGHKARPVSRRRHVHPKRPEPALRGTPRLRHHDHQVPPPLGRPGTKSPEPGSRLLVGLEGGVPARQWGGEESAGAAEGGVEDEDDVHGGEESHEGNGRRDHVERHPPQDVAVRGNVGIPRCRVPSAGHLGHERHGH